jgi:hypothetical protein
VLKREKRRPERDGAGADEDEHRAPTSIDVLPEELAKLEDTVLRQPETSFSDPDDPAQRTDDSEQSD